MVWKPPKILTIGSAVGLVVGAGVLIKDALVGPATPIPNELRADGKVVVITGANTGIGKATAREMAKRGATVYMACRNMEKCKIARTDIIIESKNKNVFCRECDLSDLQSVSDFTDQFKKEQKRLDILINNAGVMRPSKQMYTKQAIELQLGVNHMGHFLLTYKLLDTLKASAPSRIVVVSSVAHMHGKMDFEDLNSKVTYSTVRAYEQSKLANMLFVTHLAKLLKGTGVTVNGLHPGTVNTDITRHMSFNQSIVASIIVKPFMSLFLKSPEQGATTPLYVALEPSLQNVSGKYFSELKEREPAEHAKNAVDAARLWAISERWTVNRPY